MTTTEFDIKELLEQLGIKDINSGVTTGTNWLDAQGAVTSSASPIDGMGIAKIKNATIDEYEEVARTA